MIKNIFLSCMLILVTALVCHAQTIAEDDFDSGTWSGGTGWSTAWSHSGYCDLNSSANSARRANCSGNGGRRRTSAFTAAGASGFGIPRSANSTSTTRAWSCHRSPGFGSTSTQRNRVPPPPTGSNCSHPGRQVKKISQPNCECGDDHFPPPVTSRSTGWPVIDDTRSKSLSTCRTVSPANSAVAAINRSGTDGAR